MDKSIINTRRNLIVLIGFSALIILLRLPSLEEPFDNDSGAVAYSARLITRAEPLYSTHHPGHHLPGVYYTFALAFELFGDQFFSVKLLLIPWTIATASIVYRIGLYLQNHKAGLFAAIIFSMLSSHLYLKGTTAEIEMFAVLPYSATILLTTEQIQKKASGWHFLWTGVCGALAFFYKAVFLAPLVVAGGMILLDWWNGRRQTQSLRLAIERFLGLALGFAGVFIIVTGHFAFQSLLDRFWMVFGSGSSYLALTNQQPFGYIFIIGMLLLGYNNLIILVFGFLGALRILRRSLLRWGSVPAPNLLAQGIAAWFFLSLLTAGITRFGYPHYGMIVVPSLSVIAGGELAQLGEALPKDGAKQRQRLYRAGYVFFIFLAVANSVFSNWKLYSHYIRYRFGVESYSTFLEKGTIEGPVYQVNQALADYVVTHTTPEDRIYHWTDYPQVYYLADRRAPIDMIWPTQPEITGSYLRIFTEQTRYIILGSSRNLPIPGWMHEELKKAYRLETVIAGQEVYRRTIP